MSQLGSTWADDMKALVLYDENAFASFDRKRPICYEPPFGVACDGRGPIGATGYDCSTSKRVECQVTACDAPQPVADVLNGMPTSPPATPRTRSPSPAGERAGQWLCASDTHTSCITGVSRREMACLAAVAHLLGSPLQSRQPTSVEPFQHSMELVCQLLELGIDPERIIQLIQIRHEE